MWPNSKPHIFLRLIQVHFSVEGPEKKKKTMQKWHSDEYNGKKSILVYSPNLVLQLDFKCIIHVI